ncbi:MAG: hypothetical protein EP340_00610 [Alphaproteobacteria bacterium]|nr:MAG: hypothetical protein EP340_00610 [Alphaproteobacteria bacterium]
MSAYALVLVVMGLILALTRMPFVFAPARARSVFITYIADDGHMRLLGIIVSLFGVFVIWGTDNVGSALAVIIRYMGWAMIFIGVGGMALFPASLRPFAEKAVGAISDPVLRLLAAIIVAIGIMLVAHGLSL